MALPATGEISFNDLHIEAGGSTGTECTINDTDIRDMISKTAGVEMSISEWYGASSGPSLIWTTTARTVSSIEFDAPPNPAVLNINSDGTITKFDSGTIETAYLDPTGAGGGDDFEVYWTDGTYSGVGAAWNSTPTENTWLPLSSNRQWNWAGGQTANTLRTVTIVIQIRKVGGSPIAKSVTFKTQRDS
jgi:hypothetical protein